MNTRHATTRAQQRGLPPLVDQLLDRYGEEQHDGHGLRHSRIVVCA